MTVDKRNVVTCNARRTEDPQALGDRAFREARPGAALVRALEVPHGFYFKMTCNAARRFYFP